MRRGSLSNFGRDLFTVATAASLVLCAAAVALWLRSFAVAHVVRDQRPRTAAVCGISNGVLFFMRSERLPGWPDDQRKLEHWTRRPAFDLNRYRLIGTRRSLGWRTFGVMDERLADETRWNAAMPAWLPAVAFAALPIAAVRRRLRRVPTNLCARCGYDLRATPDRCPECGTVPEPPHNPPMQRTATAGSGAVE